MRLEEKLGITSSRVLGAIVKHLKCLQRNGQPLKISSKKMMCSDLVCTRH